jgi:lipoprotein NlpI
MAFTYFQYANIGIEQEKNIRQAEELIKAIYKIDPELAEAHFVQGCLKMAFQGDMKEAIGHFRKAHTLRPYDPEIMQFLSFGYDLVGKTGEAASLIERCMELDPLNFGNYAMQGVNWFFQGQFETALKLLMDMQKTVPESNMWNLWNSLIFVYLGRRDEAYDLINRYVKEPADDVLAQLCIFLKYVLKKDKKKLSALLQPAFTEAVKRDCQYSWHMATFYSFLDEIDQSLDWLENAAERGFVNFPFLSEHDRLLNNVRGEPRFRKLMDQIKHEWENFRV